MTSILKKEGLGSLFGVANDTSNKSDKNDSEKNASESEVTDTKHSKLKLDRT